MVLLKNWYAVGANGYVNLHKYNGEPAILVGNVFGHPNIADNLEVRTSPITTVDVKEWGTIVYTKNTKYYIFASDVDYRYLHSITDWHYADE